MSLVEKIDKDIKQAMLAREKDKLEALRAVKNALLVQRTEKGVSGEIDEQTEVKLLTKLVKQRKETAEIYSQNGKDDQAALELAQAKFIEVYLPEQMSEEEVTRRIQSIIEETAAQSMKDMGKVMGKASRELAGKADNKMISNIVKQLLS